MEPDKCTGWEWVEWSHLRAWCEAWSPNDDPCNNTKGHPVVFLPLANLVRQFPTIDLDKDTIPNDGGKPERTDPDERQESIVKWTP